MKPFLRGMAENRVPYSGGVHKWFSSGGEKDSIHAIFAEVEGITWKVKLNAILLNSKNINVRISCFLFLQHSKGHK